MSAETMQPCPPQFIAVGERLADAARGILLQHFRKPLEVADKADLSPVTIADRAAEATMREMIGTEFPDHGIFGEEHGMANPDAKFVWVLDPVDGTKAFLSGVPVFGTLIALLRDGVPILGIIDQPMTRERWIGAAGQATTCNGEPVGVSPRGGLAEAVLWSTSPHMFDGDPSDAAGYARLRDAVRIFHYGGECYHYAMLAAGYVDLVVEADLEPYDYCAHVPVIEGAGGVITDWAGNGLGLHSGGKVVAAASVELHRAARQILGG